MDFWHLSHRAALLKLDDEDQNFFKKLSVHRMHVSHSIFSEVPLGSSKHTEDSEINLLNAESF